MPTIFIFKEDLYIYEKPARIGQLLEGLDENEIFAKLTKTISARISHYLNDTYEVANLFEFGGEQRDPLLLHWCSVFSLYYLYRRLPNVMMPEQIVADYEATIKHLEDIAKGKINIATFPRKQQEDTNGDGLLDDNTVFKWGTRTGRSHNIY